jgi:hypothetical protein
VSYTSENIGGMSGSLLQKRVGMIIKKKADWWGKEYSSKVSRSSLANRREEESLLAS